MKEQRTSFITGKAFKAYLISAILTSIVSTVNGIVDSIIVSRAVSPDALSVVSLLAPLASIFGLFLGLLNSGVAYLSSKALGRQDTMTVKKYFSLMTYFTAAVSLLGILIVFPLSDKIAAFVSDDPRLLPMLKSYIKVDVFCVCLRYLSFSLIIFTQICGRPKLVSWRIAAETVCNVIFDLLLCVVLDLGIAGASVATSISIVLSTVVFIPYLRSKDSFLGFVPAKSLDGKLFKDSLKASVPTLLASILAPVVTFAINKLILKHIGADGIYLYCLFGQAFSLCMLVLAGCTQSISCLGGVMMGEEDYQGVKILVRQTLRVSILALTAVTLFFLISPQSIAKLYGAKPENLAAIDWTFRFVALAFIPSGISSIFIITFYITGHHRQCSALVIFNELCPLAILVAVLILKPEWIWFTVPTFAFTVLLAAVIVALLTSRKEPLVHKLTLIPKMSDNPQVTFSVPYSKEAVEEVYDKICNFITICESAKSNRIKVAVEEVMFNLLDHYSGQEDSCVFDIRVKDSTEGVSVTIKDCGPEYDPVYQYDDADVAQIGDSDLRIAVAGRMCDSISHRYMSGINCTDLFFAGH